MLQERILDRLTDLYGRTAAQELLQRLQTAERICPSRLSGTLSDGNSSGEKVSAGLWSEKDAVLITYGDSIQKPGEVPLQTLGRFVREAVAGALPIVHLLPFYPYTSDDGFSVSDYTAVRPDLGDWADVAALGKDADLMFDLVLNHCSASHVWFQQFLNDAAPGNAYFHTPEPDTDLRRVVRPRTHPLLTPYETAAGRKHVWTTFSADQVDLNFENPDVMGAFLDILLEYARKGARILRLDAIAFLWKTPGTSCLHLPETHAVVKVMRDVLDWLAPGVVLLTETNVPHAENISYFGRGDEARMVYQFSLPPLLLHGLRHGDPAALTAWARNLEPPPEGCTFFNFTASHDGIGVRPLEGLVPEADVLALAEEIRALGGKVNARTAPDGREIPYELNATYFSALEVPGDTPELHFRRFLLSQTVPMCLQGMPAYYILSLLAEPNDVAGMEKTGQNRSIHRKKLDWAHVKRMLTEPEEGEMRPMGSGQCAYGQRAFTEICARLRVRAGHAYFHPEEPQQIPDAPAGIFMVRRGGEGTALYALHNFTSQTRRVPLAVKQVLLSDAGVKVAGNEVQMPGLSFAWVLG